MNIRSSQNLTLPTWEMRLPHTVTELRFGICVTECSVVSTPTERYSLVLKVDGTGAEVFGKPLRGLPGMRWVPSVYRFLPAHN